MVKNGRDPLEYLSRAMIRWEGRADLPAWEIKQISISETKKLIQDLGNSTSFGRDKLDAKSLKSGVDYLAAPINKMINSSIESSVYIMKWKCARVIPILKSKESSRLLPSSYRPISLLPVISKLVERAVQLQLQKHFEQHHLFHPNGHVYRRNKSTSTAITQIMDNLYQATDLNMMSSMMAIDQSSAFDSVSHNLLLRKLEAYTISKKSLKWIESYLQCRSQTVDIGKHQSNSKSLDRGVPQGSILGPLLYLVFTNEMADTTMEIDRKMPCHQDRSKLFVDCTACGSIVTYADDATLMIYDHCRTLNQVKLNMNLDKLEQFLSNNELAINVAKTSIIELMISKKKKGRTTGDPPHLIVKDPNKENEMMKISDSKNFRILGANFQPNMGWKNHLETGKKAVLPDIRRKLGSLSLLGKQIPLHSRKLIAEGLLMSKLTYLIAQWGGGGSKSDSHDCYTKGPKQDCQMGNWRY